MESITLHTPDGFSLDALFGKGTNGIGIIFCHGLAFFKEGEEPFMRAADILHKKGFSTLLFDFRTNGKSSGESVKDFTIKGQLIDIATAFTFLKENGATTFFLAGASFGGGAVTLYAAAHPEIIKLVLANPSLDFNRSIHKHFEPRFKQLEEKGYVEAGPKKVKLSKKLFDELTTYIPYKELEKYQGDLLIIHGDQDEKIPHQHVVELFEKLPNPKKRFGLILGAKHGFHEEPFTTQVTEQIVQFFSTP